tara:strand:+ start:471 stop:806 length:336 start_codon:yes stop_codon:yes gene_type:complete
MRHQAIYATHPNVTSIDDDTGAFNAEGNKVEIKESLIAAEVAKLQAAEPIRLLRIERDKLLAASDWTGLADSALTSEVSAKWKLYRQKLRDLPKGLTTEFKVKNVKWPTKP